MEEHSVNTFGALLKRYRTARGWTQEELAKGVWRQRYQHQ